ncbi:MAG: hypothetical protein M1383_03815 [Patescibacteria group bacterium]|nr:hypothetical protein [Patescibacteria group bacterium]
MDYQQLKEWVAEKENRQKILVAGCFVLVFLAGFGTGRYDRETKAVKLKGQSNYNTKSTAKPAAGEAGDQTQVNTGAAAVLQAATVTPTSNASTGNCLIKGNLSSSGKKIYHVSGGAFYNIVKPEQCFQTEAEAQAAGFVKSSR